MNKQSTELHYLNSIIEHLPGSMYWKDRDGIYLDCNNYLKKTEGKSAGPVKGGTDHLAFPKMIADQIRNNDVEVMNRNCVIVRQEDLILPSGKKLVMVSSKKPFIDENGNVSGVLGISVDITRLLSNFQLSELLKINQNSAKKNKKTLLSLSGKWSGTNLTFRQAECAYYLSRGKTNNEIASILHISHRTVEDYIKQLKVKLGCFKKSTLIERVISDGILSDIINFIF